MSYHPISDLPESTWCSDSNPQGTCKPLANICKPMDAATLATYKQLQQAINRIQVRDGKPQIRVDGRIGYDETLPALNRILGESFVHCDEAAAQADEILDALDRMLAGGSPSGKSTGLFKRKSPGMARLTVVAIAIASVMAYRSLRNRKSGNSLL